MKVKILGAGSIGNHLSNAARRLGWSVDIIDPDPAALERTRTIVYPSRYGTWDDAIRLFAPDDAPSAGYDLICIGTPPDSHVPLARAAVTERPKAVLVEKPLCGPDLADVQELTDEAAAAGVAVFVGYDHVVGRAALMVADLLASGAIGEVATIDVEFREHWGGIFAAHPWLAGPWESYLGFTVRGGGASGEHSHAANLWQHFAHVVGAGRVSEVDATLDFVRDGCVDYDRLCLMNLRTETGLLGRCVQDVVTQPGRKWARIQGADGYIEWRCGAESGVDVVGGRLVGGEGFEERVSKTRADDFIEELRHIAEAIASTPATSPISLTRGIDTMRVIAAAHHSAEIGRRVKIGQGSGATDRLWGCGD
jgi:predicted dehydrogenase